MTNTEQEALIAERDRWRECAEKLRNAAKDYMDACPADPDQTVSFYASGLTLTAALAEYTRCAESTATTTN